MLKLQSIQENGTQMLQMQASQIPTDFYSTFSIKYLVPLISNENPTSFPINLFPNGDCGESAITLIPSTAIFGSAALK